MERKIKKVLFEAGKILLSFWHKKQKIGFKKDREEFCQADLLTEKFLVRELKKSFPNHQIVSEEMNPFFKSQNQPTFILDPLDGTNNFLAGIPLFSINLAVTDQKQNPILSYIFLPQTKDLFFAKKNKGAWLNDKPIRVSSEKHLNNSFIIFCRGYKRFFFAQALKAYQKIAPKAKFVRMLGAAGIELGAVASGGAEAFVVIGVKAWDLASGLLLLEEAGGKITDSFGQKLTLFDKNLTKKLIVATNGFIHHKILNLLKEN